MSGFKTVARRGAPAFGAPLLLFFLAAAPAAASVSFDLSGGGTSGPRDYKETSLEGGLTIRPEEPGPVRRARAFLNRAVYGVRSSTETTVTWTAGGALAFTNGLGLDLALWRTLEPKYLSDGSYRASGFDLGLSARWKGLLPGGEKTSFLGTEARLEYGRADHEEYFITPLPLRTVRRWYTLPQSYGGAGLTGTFRRRTSLGVEGRRYRYDRDLAALSKAFAFFAPGSTGAAATRDLILGFPQASWGARIGQDLWDWGDISLRWTRTTYALGPSPRSDATAAGLGISPWGNVGVRFTYEVLRPQFTEKSEYKGIALEAGF